MSSRHSPRGKCPACSASAARQRAADAGLSLLGLLGWLALPKCPLCLAAYLSIASGVSLSASSSRVLYLTLAGLAAACFAAGLWRIVRSNRRQHAARNLRNTSVLALGIRGWKS